ncbi:prmt9, partial [Symbiodinium sp. KB8]
MARVFDDPIPCSPHVTMEALSDDSTVKRLYMFWEPIFGSRLDVWDVWALQFVVMLCLAIQLIASFCMGVFLISTRSELRLIRESLRQARQTYLHTGVVTSDSPRIFSMVLREGLQRDHNKVMDQIRLLGKELEEYKERFLAVQGLLVVIKDHSAPLLRTVPDYLQQIQNHLDDIKDSFDEGVTKQMGILETRLISFEQEFAMQRDKIPESINKQNQAVEKICINTTVSMTQTQNTIDNLATAVEELRTYVHDTNSMLMEMSRHFSATTIVIQQNQEAMNQKIDKVNGRLLSLRGMLEDRSTTGDGTYRGAPIDAAQTVALRPSLIPPAVQEQWIWIFLLYHRRRIYDVLPTAHFVAVLFYNYMRQMRRAWQWHFSLSFEMGYYSESLERATLQVRYDMGQECIAWHHFRTHLPCWEILM